jgi:uncharacterized membrane protein
VVILVVLLLSIAAAIAGLVLLWPDKVSGSGLGGQIVSGRVASTELDCTNGCINVVEVKVTSGPGRGSSTTLTFSPGATDPKLRVGEQIRLHRSSSGAGAVYEFADIDRRTPMLWLTALFALVVLIVGRLRGLTAMIGLVFAGVVLVEFVIPALMDGRPPTLVALVAGTTIAVVVLPLAHGISTYTGAALIGTLAGMGVAALLSLLTVHALHFTGTSGDEAGTLAALGSRSTVAGLLLCGTVIGALGVLNDVTVTQAVAVFEISSADPTLTRRRLFRSGMRIGRDHIASTVYSLVLAYAGSALPVLLLFAVTDQAAGDVLSSDALGPAIVAGLIGAIALVLVVPLTTAIATAVAPQLPVYVPMS